MEHFIWFCVFVAVNALLLAVLAGNVSMLRLKHRVSLGDGGVKQLNYAIRAHANNIEQVPIFALQILALCFLNISPIILALLCIVFTAARIAHAVGMLYKIFICRRIGAGLTYLLQLLAVALLIWQIL